MHRQTTASSRVVNNEPELIYPWCTGKQQPLPTLGSKYVTVQLKRKWRWKKRRKWKRREVIYIYIYIHTHYTYTKYTYIIHIHIFFLCFYLSLCWKWPSTISTLLLTEQSLLWGIFFSSPVLFQVIELIFHSVDHNLLKWCQGSKIVLKLLLWVHCACV